MPHKQLSLPTVAASSSASPRGFPGTQHCAARGSTLGRTLTVQVAPPLFRLERPTLDRVAQSLGLSSDDVRLQHCRPGALETWVIGTGRSDTGVRATGPPSASEPTPRSSSPAASLVRSPPAGPAASTRDGELSGFTMLPVAAALQQQQLLDEAPYEFTAEDHQAVQKALFGPGFVQHRSLSFVPLPHLPSAATPGSASPRITESILRQIVRSSVLEACERVVLAAIAHSTAPASTRAVRHAAFGDQGDQKDMPDRAAATTPATPAPREEVEEEETRGGRVIPKQKPAGVLIGGGKPGSPSSRSRSSGTRHQPGSTTPPIPPPPSAEEVASAASEERRKQLQRQLENLDAFSVAGSFLEELGTLTVSMHGERLEHERLAKDLRRKVDALSTRKLEADTLRQQIDEETRQRRSVERQTGDVFQAIHSLRARSAAPDLDSSGLGVGASLAAAERKNRSLQEECAVLAAQAEDLLGKKQDAALDLQRMVDEAQRELNAARQAYVDAGGTDVYELAALVELCEAVDRSSSRRRRLSVLSTGSGDNPPSLGPATSSTFGPSLMSAGSFP